MSHVLIYQYPYNIAESGNIVVALLSIQGQKALRFHKKNILTCSEFFFVKT